MSMKQKSNSRSSAESELLAVDDVISNIMWTKYFLEAQGHEVKKNIVFQDNHYGALRPGADGNNLKDRSGGLVVRYNWIENGNRQLDLVETDHDELVADPRYNETFVYGNVLVESDGEGVGGCELEWFR